MSKPELSTIIVVILDSLSYRSAVVSKELSDFCDRYELYERNISLATAPYTPSSITTMLTGLGPGEHKYAIFPPVVLPLDVPPSAYIFANPKVDARWSTTRHEASYMFPKEYYIPLDEADKWLKSGMGAQKRVFFLHMWETHIPYGHDKEVNEAVEEMQALSGLDARIAYSHVGLKQALFKLDKLFVALGLHSDFTRTEQFSIIITSDHGEAFGFENPFVPGEKRWMHKNCLLDELTVPFYSTENLSLPKFINHIDLKDHILENLGVQKLGSNNIRIKSEKPQVASSRWMYPGEKSFIENAVLFRQQEHLIGVTVAHYDLDTYEYQIKYFIEDCDGHFPFDEEDLKTHLLVLKDAGINDHEMLDYSKDKNDPEPPMDDALYLRLRSLGYIR